jgi:hypothetical protein
MEWLDDFSVALPAPREDEPPDLRRTIIAELRDHLHAAMQRELLLTGKAEQARQNVLARFGDPARLARKLWYEAMWEKIMTQRLTLVALVAVVLVSIASMGLTWFLVVQAGQVNQAILEQNRATNELMLAKLAALGNAGGSTGKLMEWNSLKVHLSLEELGGPPAVGFKVDLLGQVFDAGTSTSLDRTTGPDGVADFGLVRPGQYLFDVETPWGESIDSGEMHGRLVAVLPGEPQTLEIVCPSPLEETEITISVDWPNDLAGQPLWLVCDFVRSPRDVGGQLWARNNDDDPRYIAIDPTGQLTTNDIQGSGDGRNRSNRSKFSFFRDGESFYVDPEKVMRSYVEDSRSDADSPGIYLYNEPVTSRYAAPRIGEAMPPHIWLSKTAAVSRLKWPAGKYSVAHFAVGREAETGEEALSDDLLHPVFLGGIALNIDGGYDDDQVAVRLLYPDEERASARRRNRRGGKPTIPRFEAVAGRLNEWRLTLPESLVELLTDPKAEPEAQAPIDNPPANLR